MNHDGSSGGRVKHGLRTDGSSAVGGRRWRGAALAVAGLVVLILLPFLTSIKVMDQSHLKAKIDGSEDSKVLDSTKTDQTSGRPGLGTKTSLDSEGGYVTPSRLNLQQAVGTEPRFLVMDRGDAGSFFDLRVNIETVVNLATISDRIPVIPGHVWIRSCRVKFEECTRYSLEHREESWRGAEGWKIGISSDDSQHLLDIPHLRKTYGLVLTQFEFSTLFNVTPEMTLWSQAGVWNMESTALDGFSTSEITFNEWFNNAQFVRIDENLPSWTESKSEAVIIGLSTGRVREIQVDDARRVWSLPRARELLRKNGFKVDGDDHWFEEALRKVEQSRVYSFDERSDRIKTVAQPTYVSGPIWNEGKLGGVHFASQEAHDRFVNMTEAAIRPPKEYVEAGRMVTDNMATVDEGRAWLATEMTSVAAAHTQGSRSAEARILNQLGLLEKGVAELSAHKVKNVPSKDHLQVLDKLEILESYHLNRQPPTYRYFLATDETDPPTLATFQRRRAVVLTDLLSETELKILGWRAMFADLLQLVEQEVLAASEYFVGSGSSKRSGAVLDARSAPRFGRDGWSWSLDEWA